MSALLFAPHASVGSKVKSDVVAKRRSKQHDAFIIQWVHQVFWRTVSTEKSMLLLEFTDLHTTGTQHFNHWTLLRCYLLSLSLCVSLSPSVSLSHTRTHARTSQDSTDIQVNKSSLVTKRAAMPAHFFTLACREWVSLRVSLTPNSFLNIKSVPLFVSSKISVVKIYHSARGNTSWTIPSGQYKKQK